MKKKGFTLIELLAVIIILAVIALIATPVVLNVVEKATENARKNSVLGYADSVKLSYAEEILENTGKPLKELANNKTQGSKVECEYVKYDEQRYGSLLHTCSVNEKGNYCYFKGVIYDSNSGECETVLSLIQNGVITYNPPIIEQVSQTPSDTTYAQSKDIKVSYPSIKIVEENYFIRVSETVELNNVVNKCGINELPGECTTYNGVIESGTWYKVNGELTFTIDKNIVVEAITGNNNEFSSKTTYQENKIDKTEPNAFIGSINVKTDRAVVTAICNDFESGITKYEFSNDDGATWIDNGTNAGYAFTGLTQNTEYKFAIRCTNGSGISKKANDSKTTSNIKVPEIVQSSQKPTDTNTYPTYASERVIKITYYGDNIESPKYYYSLNGTTWTEVTGTTKDLTFTENGRVYAKTVDESGNVASASTYSVVNIDTTVPNVDIAVGTMQTDRTTVTATCSDDISGIVKYEFSKDNGSTWVANGTTSSYTFTGLTQNTSYTFAVRCTNGAALTKTASSDKSTTGIVAPTITQVSQTPSSGTYAQSRVIRITYSATNVASPKYYYSTDGSTWTEVTGGTTKDLTFTANGKVYAKTVDATGNTTSASTYSVVNIDTTVPNVSIAVGTMQTDRATITATCADDISGIVKYEFSKDNGSTWVANGTTSSYTFTGLTQNTSYTFAVRCTNGSGLTKTESSDKSTTGIVAPTIAQVSQTPSSGTYAQSRVIRITYSATNVASPKYYYSTDGSTWTEVTGGTTKDLTFTANGKVYAKTVDATGNTASASTYSVVNIDASAPSLTLGTVSSTSSVITVPFTASDSESGIKSTTCVYGTSTSYGSTGTISGTNCVISGLTANTTYYYKVTTTNGVGALTDKTGSTGTLTLTNPTIAQESATIASGYTWATQRVIKITYSATNSSSPTYYFKSTVAATVASGVVTQACGTGTNPGTCSVSSVTTLAANTWYRTTSTTPSITYTANGTLYAVTKDGNNLSGQASYTVAQTSTGTPSAPAITGGSTSWSTTAKTISVSTASSETSGIKNYQYCISTSTSSCNGTWTNTTTSATSQSISTEGTRYIYFRAVANNGKVSAASAYQTTKIDTVGPTAPTITVTSTSTTSKKVIVTTPSTATSGIAYYEYFIENEGTPSQYVDLTTPDGTTIDGTFTKTISAGGSFLDYIWYRAIDNAGNAGPLSNYGILELDDIPPLLQSVTGTSTTWAKSKTITVTYTSNNGPSSVSQYCYYVSDSTTAPTSTTGFTCVNTSSGSATITVTTQGKYIYFYAKKANGKTSPISSAYNLYVDTTKPAKPTVALKLGSASGSVYTSGSLTNQDVYHIVTSSDSGSGISYYQYSHNGTSGWSNDISTLGWGSSYNSNKTQLTYRINFSGSWNFYVRAVDAAGNISDNSTMFTVTLDKDNPTVSATVSGKTATISLADNRALSGYTVTTSTSTPTSWTSVSGTSASKTWTATAAGTYYAWVKDTSGRTAYKAFTIASTAFCSYSIGKTWDFAYTGGIQTFTVPCAGTYKLEVWGAQGGTHGGVGGNGGYSYGNYSSTVNRALYIVVGGKGQNGANSNETAYYTGGYNGGGNGSQHVSVSGSGRNSSGGGATHIATTTGLLSTLSSNKSSVLIVAGGGGGGGANWDGTSVNNGGAGGGTNGSNGACEYFNAYGASGGSQTAGGSGLFQAGSFGQGGNSQGDSITPSNGSGNVGSGGGGGYYGGGGAGFSCGGGGGAGYIGGVTGGSMSNGQRSGDGYARITLVSTQ